MAKRKCVPADEVVTNYEFRQYWKMRKRGFADETILEAHRWCRSAGCLATDETLEEMCRLVQRLWSDRAYEPNAEVMERMVVEQRGSIEPLDKAFVSWCEKTASMDGGLAEGEKTVARRKPEAREIPNREQRREKRRRALNQLVQEAAEYVSRLQPLDPPPGVTNPTRCGWQQYLRLRGKSIDAHDEEWFEQEVIMAVAQKANGMK